MNESSNVSNKIDFITKHFQLTPHPEGGFYNETYRASEQQIFPVINKDSPRNFSTAIYFLLPQGHRSLFHKIKADEVWHFYSGGPLKLIEISEDIGIKETIIGSSFDKNQTPQYVVKAGHWFGAIPCDESEYSFVGCTVAPGFDFHDFELANKKELLDKYPQFHFWIENLTK